MVQALLIEWRHAVAGCVAGLSTVVALHPLDVIKTRMQVQDGGGGLLPTYHGTIHCFKTILRREGLPGLYAGLAPCLIASGLSWSLYFLFYNRSKSSWRQKDNKTKPSPVQHLWSGIEAGVFEASKHTGKLLKSARYPTLRRAVVTIAAEEGIRGFYKGLGPSLLMCTNAAIQFAIYEELRQLVSFLTKKASSKGQLDTQQLSSGAVFIIGGISKATASIITYPTQVMRSRLQQRFDVGRHLRYSSLKSAFFLTYQREGVRGFYKGLVPSILRVVPQASLMFMVYEKVFEVLQTSSEETVGVK